MERVMGDIGRQEGDNVVQLLLLSLCSLSYVEGGGVFIAASGLELWI